MMNPPRVSEALYLTGCGQETSEKKFDESDLATNGNQESRMMQPECGQCVRSGSAFAYESATVTVKPGVQKIQYQEPDNFSFVDITNALYVMKGTTVTFKAIPNPQNSSFPSGSPTWSGTSGVSSTGETVSVTFNTTSSSTSDYKTVTATSGTSSVTVNMIVYEITPVLAAEVDFYGRSNTSFGLKEAVYTYFSSTPAITYTEIGNLRWFISQGSGSITNDPRNNGYAVFDAGASPDNVILRLTVQNGPSKGFFVDKSINIIAPTSAYMVKLPSDPVLHCQNFSSVGFQGQIYLLPSDVAFTNIYFQEGYEVSPSYGYGFYSPANNQGHDPTGIGVAVEDCNIVTGCKTFKDTLYTLNWRNWTGNWGVGQYRLPIQWKYGFNENDPIQNYVQFTTATHEQETDDVGTATISKAGSGSYSKMVADQTVNSGPLQSCLFPQAP
jgi:hypothetical protein